MIEGAARERTAERRSWRPRLAAPFALGRLSLARQFLLASLALVVGGGVVAGTLLGQLIERSALDRTASLSALYVDSFIQPRLQSLATQSRLDATDVAALRLLLTDSALGERVVSFRVWSPSGEIVYSSNPALIGRRFEVGEGLAQGLTGVLSAHVSELREPANAYERERWSRLLEMYLPVREEGGPRIIAVTEFYQLPDELEAEVTRDRLAAWAVVAATALIAYLVLARIVRRGSDTIVRQEVELRRRVGDLSELLRQNARLGDRIRQAGARTTALNEQERRRISSDLHDGPGQTLGLALLRMDAIARRLEVGESARAGAELEIVRDALRGTLDEMRAIAAGLRMPELATASPGEAIQRAIADHERRAGASIRSRIDGLPASAPLATKIALFRILQEALSNATRHAGGRGVEVEAGASEDSISVVIVDHGPGFDPRRTVGGSRLGLVGMRERAELLGGQLEVESTPKRGTTVRVSLPLIEEDREA